MLVNLTKRRIRKTLLLHHPNDRVSVESFFDQFAAEVEEHTLCENPENIEVAVGNRLIVIVCSSLVVCDINF